MSTKYSHQGQNSINKSKQVDENMSNKESNINTANSVTLKGRMFSIEEDLNKLEIEANNNQTDVDSNKNFYESMFSGLENKLNHTNETLLGQINSVKDLMEKHFREQQLNNEKQLSELRNLEREKELLTKKINEAKVRLIELGEMIRMEDNYYNN